MQQRRQIVLDTETTGLEVAQRHRVIEIGAVEVLERRLTNRHFHFYLQPDREIDVNAFAVHGISNEFLSDKPRFAEIAEDFLQFIAGAELIIHNAPFDVGFLNYELSLLTTPQATIEQHCSIIDSLTLARSLHPGQRNTLDALCRRYGIDNSQRQLHGALLDSEILAEVYLAMTGGQVDLALEASTEQQVQERHTKYQKIARPEALKVVSASAAEQQAHQQYLQMLDEKSGGNCVWNQLQ